MQATLATAAETRRGETLAWCSCGNLTELSETSSFVCLGSNAQDSRPHFCCTRCTSLSGRTRTCLAHNGKTAIDTRGLFFDYVGKNYTRCPWGCWMPAGQTAHVCRRITTRVKIPGFYGTYWWDDIVKKTKARLNINRICIAGTAVAKIAPAVKGAQPEALEVLIEEPGCIGVVEIKWVSIDAVRRSQRAVVDMGKKRSIAHFFPVGPFAPGSLHATNCKLHKIKLVEKACSTTDQLMGQPLGVWKKIMRCSKV